MSRRKNAGAGYGYMFHGAFSEKKDAVAKERKTKGAWVKGTPTANGYRYIVMSPRTNPRKVSTKPKKETKGQLLKRRLAELAAAPVRNPAELLVMGANPSAKRTIDLPAGSEITIRVNPEPNPYFGFGPGSATKKERAASRRSFKSGVRAKGAEMDTELKRLRRSARASFKDKGKLHRLFHDVYSQNPAVCGKRIGSETCSRKPGHRGPCLPQGATMRTRTRLKRGWQPRSKNPSAAALREDFTGMPSEFFEASSEPHIPKGDYAQLGELLALYVKPAGGGQVQHIDWRKGERPLVLGDESARQLWFAGGNQDMSSGLAVFGARSRGAGLFELGEARRIDYKQRKAHVPQPEIDEWRHEFGEESGVRPLVVYDANNQRILLEGGEYEIRAEGIVN